ncbi:hypothetical protein ACIO3O_40095 [Streptomyces sp. NPDC087440]|uniref:hypothetical protein n=1 Tax=Streptomyces sp. NPDC087440 TaxID=3365790 RepID=UPI003801B44A
MYDPQDAESPVLDPDLDKKTRTLLLRSWERPFLYGGGTLRPAAVMFQGAGPTACATAGAGALSVYLDGTAATLNSHTANGFLLGKLAEVAPILQTGALMGVAYIGLLGYFQWHSARRYNVERDAERAAREHMVIPSELTAEAQVLLTRARTALTAVLTSTVHHQNLLDRQRNDLLLPAHLWEIAEGLRDYSRLAAQEPDQPEGERVRRLLAGRRQALAQSLAGAEHRVTALEAYAAEAARADSRYTELHQIQHLTDTHSNVLDLLARTARDDLAATELDGMTGEASLAVHAFAQALDAAQQAADSVPAPYAVAKSA